MRTRGLVALALATALSHAGSTLIMAQPQPTPAACAADCATKFDACKSDCYSEPEFADSEAHKAQCARTCDQNFNFVCVQKCK